MMNLKDCLNSLRSLINHIAKVCAVLIIIGGRSYCQQISVNDSDSDKQDSVFVMAKSPWGAVLRSAVIPGWGQFYNESYLKIPVIWGLGIWFGYEWKQNNDSYKFYTERFKQTGNNLDKLNRTFYQDQRDLFTIYMVITYLANLIDAYVDANLFDFDVSENAYTKTPMLNIRVNF
jgi:hypothetical protein